MDATCHPPQRTTTQLILAWMELARMQRQIQRLRASEHDEFHVRALEDSRAVLLRIASQRIGAAPDRGAPS